MTAARPVNNYPSVRKRIGCLFYETLLLLGLLVISGIFNTVWIQLTGQKNPALMQGVTFVLYGVYFTWFWHTRGQTLPMQTWRIKLLTIQNQQLSVARCVARYVVASAWCLPAALLSWVNHWSAQQSLWAGVVGLLAYAALAFLHPERQFWHDAVCNTHLVQIKQ
jgi:uncharacterized RDD family membrane protein YckC